MKTVKFLNQLIWIIVVINLNPLAAIDSFQPTKLIFWHSDIKLTWDDFRGRPNNNSPFGAIASTGISAPCKPDESGNMIAIVDAYFDRSKSWIKSEKQTPEALEHEQGHFDIAEIHARKLRRSLSQANLKKKNFSKSYLALYDECTRELAVNQKTYDVETDHHKNRDAQFQWDQKIRRQLNELEAYSSSKITISLK